MSDVRLAAFNELAMAVCSAGRLDEPDAPKARADAFGIVTCAIRVDETEVALAYLPGPDQSHFNVLIDAGAAPSAGDAESWAALMELDFAMVSSRHDACFCCDESRKLLQLRMVFRLGDIDAPQLAAAIAEGVKAVRIWQASSGEMFMPQAVDGISYGEVRP